MSQLFLLILLTMLSVSITIRTMVWLSGSSRKILRRLGFVVITATMGCVIGMEVVLLLNHILLLGGLKSLETAILPLLEPSGL